MLSNSRATAKSAEQCSTSHEAQRRMFTTTISTSTNPQAQNHTRTRSAFSFNRTLRDEGSIWQALSTLFPSFLLAGLATKLGVLIYALGRRKMKETNSLKTETQRRPKDYDCFSLSGQWTLVMAFAL